MGGTGWVEKITQPTGWVKKTPRQGIAPPGKVLQKNPRQGIAKKKNHKKVFVMTQEEYYRSQKKAA